MITVNAKTQYGITEHCIGVGCACEVYKTENPDIVFKLYFSSVDFNVVLQIWERHKLYAQKGLAPQLYGEIIEYEHADGSGSDSRYGFFTERITLPNELDLKEFDRLQDQLKATIKDDMSTNELDHNWGITKDGKPVLYDFCEITSRLIGIIE